MPRHALPGFVLDLPDGYLEEPAAGGARAFRSASGEALAIAGASLGGGSDAQQRMQRDRLVQGAIKDVQRDACQPDLEVLVPLSRAPGAEGLETWHLVARSAAGRLFAQAVAASADAVVILRYDGRNTREAVARWFAVVESVRAAPLDR